jgi:4'-phosphopantetheinyl transferase
METHCWIIDLEGQRSRLEIAERRLGLPTARATALAQERRLSQIAVRLAIRARAGIAPARQPFLIDRSGKPRIADGSVHFNLSHSGGTAAVAVSSSGPVGIDIERLRPLRIAEHRREQLLSAARRLAPALLETTNDALRADIISWTILEAVAKHAATGVLPLIGRLKRPDTPEPAHRLQIECSGDALSMLDKINGTTTGVTLLPVPDGFVGALCHHRGATVEMGSLTDLFRGALDE